MRARERAFDRRNQLRICELTRRQVHGNRQAGCVGRFGGPTGRLRACLLQHPRADRDDQPGVLRGREELARRKQAALRVLPAHERFEADYLVPCEMHERLVVHAELVAEQGAAQ
jgi:hypothetical protein